MRKILTLLIVFISIGLKAQQSKIFGDVIDPEAKPLQ
jgi:hypothetical protein